MQHYINILRRKLHRRNILTGSIGIAIILGGIGYLAQNGYLPIPFNLENNKNSENSENIIIEQITAKTEEEETNKEETAKTEEEEINIPDSIREEDKEDVVIDIDNN